MSAYGEWLAKIPTAYRVQLLDDHGPSPSLHDDPHRVASFNYHRSLMPLALAARKPMFKLKPADGARGAHIDAVQDCYRDFLALARRIGLELGVSVP